MGRIFLCAVHESQLEDSRDKDLNPFFTAPLLHGSALLLSGICNVLQCTKGKISIP